MAKTAVLGGFVLVAVLATGNSVAAQAVLPVKWHFTTVPLSDTEARIIFTANLQEGWHLYPQLVAHNGPMPTTFTFVPDVNYSLKGDVNEESIPLKGYDPVFRKDMVWYRNTVVFSQDVQLQASEAVIHGKIEFMACALGSYLPPDEVKFSLEVKTASQQVNTNKDSNTRHRRYSGPGSSYNGLLLQQKTGNSSIVKKV